jgi:hypothetical protein
MSAKVTIVFDGLDTVLQNLTKIEEKAPQNLQTQIERLAKDTEQAWKQATPRRTGRLQSEESAQTVRFGFTLNNSTKYYPFVNDGHLTPRGWHTRRGYRLAKRRSRVPGQHMTEKAMEFVTQNILEYLAKFLDNV